MNKEEKILAQMTSFSQKVFNREDYLPELLKLKKEIASIAFHEEIYPSDTPLNESCAVLWGYSKLNKLEAEKELSQLHTDSLNIENAIQVEEEANPDIPMVILDVDQIKSNYAQLLIKLKLPKKQKT